MKEQQEKKEELYIMTQKNLFKDKKELAKYINNRVYQILREYGYKKNGNDFYIKKTGFSCIISIQKNKYVEEEEEYFTLNWGLDFFLDQAFYNKKLTKHPSYNRSLIGGGIAALKDKISKSWQLFVFSNSAEIQIILEQIEYYIKEYGTPFLSKLNTIEDVIKMLESIKSEKGFYGFYPSHTNPEPFQAILYLYINQKEKSLAIIDEIINTTKSKLYKENMIDLKEKIKDFDPTQYEINYLK
jgi:hypothetical protein